MALPSATELYANLKKNEHGIYAASANIGEDAEYFYGGRRGSSLIFKGTSGEAEEYLLSGIFEVDRCDCYLSPDGSFDPNNALRQALSDVKLNCRLRPVQRDPNFAFSAQDWPLFVKNIKKLEDMAPLENGEDRKNVLHVIQGTSSTDGGFIKIVHPLFERKDPNDKNGIDETTKNWPVQERCKTQLAALLNTHVVVPFPVFDTTGSQIEPQHYLEKIAGAIVQVHFAIQHCFIKKDKQQTIFSASIREMNILRHAIAPPTSPMKKHCFMDGPITMQASGSAPSTPTKKSKRG